MAVHRVLLSGLLATGVLACDRPRPASLLREPAPQVGVEHPPDALPLPRARDATFRRGVTIGPLIAPDSVDQFKRAQIKRLTRAVALGATDVRLIVRWTQTQPDSVELAPFDSIDDPLLGWLIKAARARKLRVWLVPTVAVESAEGARTAASVAPTDWDRWWWSYRRFVLHYAQLAARKKLALFAVGNGLTSTERDAERWRTLIAEVRKQYAGELTYVASAASFEQVQFWDALDVTCVAVSPTAAPEATLTAELATLPARIEKHAPTRDYLVTEPDPGVELPDADLALRRHRAVYRSFYNAPALAGVFMNDTADDTAKKTPPSAELLRFWFQKSRP